MTDDTQRSTLVPRFAHWRALILVGCSVGSGLVLDVMVLGSGPERPVDAVAALSTTVVTVGDTAPTVPLITAAAVPAASVEPSTTPTTVPPVATAVTPLVQAPRPAGSAITPPPVPAAAPTATQPPPTPPPTGALPTTPPPTSPPPTSPPPTTAPAASSGPPATPPPTTAPQALSVTYPSYSVPTAGDVVLAFTDASTLTLWSVAPNASWGYEVERNGPRSVEVKFFNTQTHNEAEFHAEIDGSRIKVEYGG